MCFCQNPDLNHLDRWQLPVSKKLTSWCILITPSLDYLPHYILINPATNFCLGVGWGFLLIITEKSCATKNYFL